MALRLFDVRSLSAEDLSVSMFILPYYFALLYGSFVYPHWDRFGLRVQILCVGVLAGIGVIVSSVSALRRFQLWFYESKIYRLSIYIVSWLLLMWWVHRAEGVMLRDGVFSGLLAIIASPFVVYCCLNCSRFWRRFWCWRCMYRF